MADLDLIIKEAQIRGKSDLVDIGIRDGHIAFIGQDRKVQARQLIKADGRLTTVPFVNPHMHLDKVYTLPMVGEQALRAYQGTGMGKAMNAVEIAASVKDHYDPAWIIPNVRRALALAAKFGCLHLRAFADVDPIAGQDGINSLLAVKAEFEDILDIQITAFAEDGIQRLPGNAELIRQSMKLGANVVGGHPFIEFTDSDATAHIRQIFEIARQFDAPVSMLVDDAGDPSLRQLEIIANQAIEYGWQGRTLAHHARAMSLYPQPYFEKLASILRRAKIGVVANPHTGPLYTRVRDLLAAGCLVCLGQDDISDAYYPYGRHNMLEVAFLASHLMWMTTKRDMEILYDMVTVRPAQAIGLELDISVGAPANMIVLEASNVLEALRNHEAPAYVISKGQTVDQAAMQSIIDETKIHAPMDFGTK